MLSANINGVWRSSVLGGDLSTGPLLSLLGGVTCKFSSSYVLGYGSGYGAVHSPLYLDISQGNSSVRFKFSASYVLGYGSGSGDHFSPKNLTYQGPI